MQNGREPDDRATFDAVGSEALYERFRPDAVAFADGPIRTPNVDANLAVQNARTGVNAVLAHRARLEKEIDVSIEKIATLPELGSGFLFLSAQLDRTVPTPTEFAALRSRTYDLRALLLTTGDALALSGFLPRTEIDRIRKGRGPIDAAEDCVALGALFREHWATVGTRVSFDQATVEETSIVGSQLLDLLRPKGTAERTDVELVELARLRDRFWSLFSYTWEWQVWRAGAWLFGRAVDEHVPPLGSRVVSKRTEDPSSGI